MRNNLIRKSNKTNGFILVMVMLVLLTNAVLVMGMLALAGTELQMATNRVGSLQAEYIAHAGVSAAIDNLQQNGATNTTVQATFPSGSDQYSAVITTGTPVKIVSTGTTAGLGINYIFEIECSVTGASSPYTVSISQWKQVLP